MCLEEAVGLGGLVCERNASTSKSRLGIVVRKCLIGEERRRYLLVRGAERQEGRILVHIFANVAEERFLR